MNPYLVYPESFPVTPRLNFRIMPTWPPRGFGIGLANPRVSLHHSCAACVIVAAPGVIKSAIPAGIFAVPVPAMLVKVRLGLLEAPRDIGVPVLAKPNPQICREGRRG